MGNTKAKVDQAMVDKVKELAIASDENFLELGKTLRALQESNTKEFLSAVEDSGLGKRKAYYLVDIDRTFSTIPVQKGRLKKLGWTKLNELAPSINSKNYVELIKAAETYTVKELKSYLSGKKPEEKKKAFLTYLDSESYEALAEAFARVGAKSYSRGWLNKAASLTALAQTVANLPENVFAKYGVKAKNEPD